MDKINVKVGGLTVPMEIDSNVYDAIEANVMQVAVKMLTDNGMLECNNNCPVWHSCKGDCWKGLQRALEEYL